MSTYYLSGPMTGLPDLNYSAFRNAALELRAMGHSVYNPADWETYGDPHGLLGGRREFNLQRAFEDYTRFIIYRAEAVVVLPGWDKSPGATAEAALARALGKPVWGWVDGALVEMSTAPRPPACPDHKERQHRDGNPPWCCKCGWRRAVPAQAPVKIGTSRAERDMQRAQAEADRLADLP